MRVPKALSASRKLHDADPAIKYLITAARVALPAALLIWLIQRYGVGAFTPALEVLRPGPILIAIVLSAAAIAAQAERWRAVAAALGIQLERSVAYAECYRAAALNAALPGGIVGDASRAWRQRLSAGLRKVAGSVIAERATGLVVLFAAAACAAAYVEQWQLAGMAVLAGFASWLVTHATVRRLGMTAVWAWSALALLGYLVIGLSAAAVLDVAGTLTERTLLVLLILAGMAVPLNLGGWGPRELAGAAAATTLGLPAEEGIALAAGYGLLSTIGVLPGLLLVAMPDAIGKRHAKVQLDAGVGAEAEPA